MLLTCISTSNIVMYSSIHIMQSILLTTHKRKWVMQLCRLILCLVEFCLVLAVTRVSPWNDWEPVFTEPRLPWWVRIVWGMLLSNKAQAQHPTGGNSAVDSFSRRLYHTMITCQRTREPHYMSQISLRVFIRFLLLSITVIGTDTGRDPLTVPISSAVRLRKLQGPAVCEDSSCTQLNVNSRQGCRANSSTQDTEPERAGKHERLRSPAPSIAKYARGSMDSLMWTLIWPKMAGYTIGFYAQFFREKLIYTY